MVNSFKYRLLLLTMISLVEDIRRETSFAGVSLLCGNAHACEIKVTKEEVRSLLLSS